MKKLLHKLAHIFCINKASYIKYEMPFGKERVLVEGFKCIECGVVD